MAIIVWRHGISPEVHSERIVATGVSGAEATIMFNALKEVAGGGNGGPSTYYLMPDDYKPFEYKQPENEVNEPPMSDPTVKANMDALTEQKGEEGHEEEPTHRAGGDGSDRAKEAEENKEPAEGEQNS